MPYEGVWVIPSQVPQSTCWLFSSYAGTLSGSYLMNDCHFSSHKNSHCKFVSKGIQYKIVLLCRCWWSWWWWWWWCLFSVKEREEEGGDGKDRSQKKAAASSNEQLASTNQLSSLTALIRNWECQPVHNTSLPFCLLFWFTWISSH